MKTFYPIALMLLIFNNIKAQKALDEPAFLTGQKWSVRSESNILSTENLENSTVNTAPFQRATIDRLSTWSKNTGYQLFFADKSNGGVGGGIEEIPGEYTQFQSSNIEKNRQINNCTKSLTLTGLVMMAGGIKYFVKRFRDKRKDGLKLTTQTASFGFSTRTCKKVTGLTYAIAIGK